MRPKGALHATALHRSSHFWGFWPLGAHAREASEKFQSSKVGKLASWNRKVGKLEREQGEFEGSNTPKGQRPGEFLVSANE